MVEYLVDADNRYSSGPGPSPPAGGGSKKIDYREILSPEDFALFAKLRDWRKQQATHEGIPVYNIFDNEQLSQIAVNKITTKAALQQIKGVGEARVKNYGEAVIRLVGAELAQRAAAKDNAKDAAKDDAKPAEALSP